MSPAVPEEAPRPFPQEGLKRLVTRILGGEVVFFIGAGFSLDSEPNSSWDLIARLLVRFEAITDLLEKDKGLRSKNPLEIDKIRGDAKRLRARLVETFSLQERKIKPALPHKKNLEKLSRDYYLINDWICNAFGELLEAVFRLEDPAGFNEAVELREKKLLHSYSASMVPNQKMYLDDLVKLQGRLSRGKALFLDTLGFVDQKVMAGEPLNPRLDRVAASYTGERGERLRPRHHTLAWLGREGLCPVLLTTNYDLLLEGAFRLAGFTPRIRMPEGIPLSQDPVANNFLPPTTYHYYSTVADPTQFFGQGDDRRAAQILKLHGSVDLYRDSRARPPHWAAYLPSMVFTFREIQDWRRDSWSRDYLMTLLRTRTLVFCGYSGMDQVVHHTFRTVYEEMAERRRERRLVAQQAQSEQPDHPDQPPPEPVDARQAPAFFFGLAQRKEFHGLEILRAASQAAGTEIPDLADHPNYLQFFPVKDPGQRFPRLDEVKQWIFHSVFRQRQRQALESDLGRTAILLLGQPQPESEIQAIRQGFDALIAAEEAQAAGWTEQPVSRLELERTVGWTQGFQAGLLRQLALGDAVLRHQRPGLELEELREHTWYYPILDHTDWAAWCTVVEIAVRRMIAARRGDPDWTSHNARVRPGTCTEPAVFFSTDQKPPDCLIISLASFGRQMYLRGIPGSFRRPVAWDLRPEEIPWPRDDSERQAKIPPARLIWRWSHLPDLANQPEFDSWFERYFS